MLEVVLYASEMLEGMRRVLRSLLEELVVMRLCCSVYWRPWRVDSGRPGGLGGLGGLGRAGRARRAGGDAPCAALYTGGLGGLGGAGGNVLCAVCYVLCSLEAVEGWLVWRFRNVHCDSFLVTVFHPLSALSKRSSDRASLHAKGHIPTCQPPLPILEVAEVLSAGFKMRDECQRLEYWHLFSFHQKRFGEPMKAGQSHPFQLLEMSVSNCLLFRTVPCPQFKHWIVL